MEETGFYTGKIVVFTGRLETMRRSEAAKLVYKSGGEVTGTVTAKTNIVVIGANVGEEKRVTRKYSNAKRFIENGHEMVILTEDEFLLNLL
ncbi:MAG: BRCT domain-containing protein [Bacillaceae bacterium]